MGRPPAHTSPSAPFQGLYVLLVPLRYTDPSGHRECEGFCDDNERHLPAPQPQRTSFLQSNPTPTSSTGPKNRDSWQTQIVQNLSSGGINSQWAAQYLVQNGVQIRFRSQRYSGAMWWLDGNIYLDADTYSETTSPDDPFMLALIAHETKHLAQGPIVALSVYGELEAWQFHHTVYKELAGPDISLGPAWDALSALPLDNNRKNLMEASKLMSRASPGYRSGYLPLYPVHAEFAYWHGYATNHAINMPAGAD